MGCVCMCLSWRQAWWWEEAGLGQAAVLRAVRVLRWRAWAAHCGVLRARRHAFVQVRQILLFLLFPPFLLLHGEVLCSLLGSAGEHLSWHGRLGA